MIPIGAMLFQPVLPFWLLAVVVLGLAGGAWITYSRCSLSPRERIGLWALRMGSVFVLCWLLCQP